MKRPYNGRMPAKSGDGGGPSAFFNWLGRDHTGPVERMRCYGGHCICATDPRPFLTPADDPHILYYTRTSNATMFRVAFGLRRPDMVSICTAGFSTIRVFGGTLFRTPDEAEARLRSSHPTQDNAVDAPFSL